MKTKYLLYEILHTNYYNKSILETVNKSFCPETS